MELDKKYFLQVFSIKFFSYSQKMHQNFKFGHDFVEAAQNLLFRQI